MDEIKQRLQENSQTCLTCYEKWAGDKKNGAARESLLESIHELRKVASRLEIELAVSERNENAQKRIPIPPHRDARPGKNDRSQGKGAQGERQGDTKGEANAQKANREPAQEQSDGAGEKPSQRRRSSGAGKK